MTSHRAFHAATLVAFLAFAAPFAAHASVEQVADIYPAPGDIRGSISNSPQVFKSNNGTLFFTASTPSDSRELWATDGTSGGTRRLTDNPGYNPTLINSAALLGDELYFVPSSADGLAVWKTDGTVAGTQKAFEPIPGSNNYRILALTAANGMLYFGVEINGQYSIWVSDGTAAGTRKITTIGAYHFGGHYFAPADGKVVFTTDDGTHGFEPWVTDGTAGGTKLLEDIRGSEGSNPRGFVAWGDKTLFTTKVGSLFFTDGSVVTAINATDGAAAGTEADDVTVVGSDVYYTARTYVSSGTVFTGRHLWHADGSGGDATLVDPGSVSDELTVDNLAAAGSDLYFTVSTGTNETLYKWDGAAKTAVLDAGTDTIGNVVYAGGKLYFTRTGSVSGLFVYDGATIQPLKDVDVKVTTTSGGKLFMAADDGTHGREPWVSDGTPAGTHMIDNLAAPDAGSYPDGITVGGGRLLFAAYWLGQSYEPSISDGTAAGTRLLQDIASGLDDSDPWDFTAVGDTVYFGATDSDGDNLLWKVAADGSGATSVGTGLDDPEDLVALNGELYFAAWTIADSQYELWKSDGTAAGTVVVSKDADLLTLTVAGGKLFFGAWGSGDADPQLWVSDGTEAGTKELTSTLSGFNPFESLTPAGTKVYFTADDGTHGDEIWVTDGTVTGTHLVKDIVPGADGSDPDGLTAYDGYLYFCAFTAEAGYEIWRTDGTAAGTGLFADIIPGAQSPEPDDLIVAGGKLYFTAGTPTAGTELWATDGGKPVQVKDISPGPKGSESVDLTAIGNRVVFTASDGVTGYEPWISDGTAAGTHMIGDVNIGADSSNPDNYVFFKRQLFFAADDGETGYELWRADINRRPIAAGASATVKHDTAFDGTFKATDPDGDALTFGIADAPAHGNIKITDAATGEFTYTPTDGYSGKDSFRFNADDGLANSSAAVSIQVQGGAPSDDDTPPPPDSGGAGSGGSGGGGAWGLLGGLLMLGALLRRRFAKQWERIDMQKIISSVCTASVLWLATVGFAAHAAVEEVKDINSPPGINIGSIIPFLSSLASKNGTAYFGAQTLSEGTELWFTDGTAAGTHRVTDTPGGDSTLINSEAYLGDNLYFTVDGKTGDAIWTSDGTAAGTKPVFELVPGPSNEDVLGLTAVDGKLYFDVLNDNRFSVWTSDGTTAGTHIIKVINTNQTSLTGYSFGPAPNGEVLFNADDGTHGTELWITDGTAGGTHMLDDIEPGANGSHPGAFTMLPGKTVFLANDVLWSTDGSAAGTAEIPLVTSGGTDTAALPQNLRVVDGVLFFRAVHNGGFWELWRWDGSGSIELVDLSGAGTFDSVKSDIAVGGMNLYFVAKEPDATLQLLKVDSAGTGVTELKDLGPDSGGIGGFGGTDIGSAAFLDGKLYFTIGSPPFFLGGPLYVTDGTMAGTAKLVDGVSAAGLTASGHKLFFAGGNAGAFTLEPWVSDGTAAGTHQIEDLNGSISESNPYQLTVAGGRLVFGACDAAAGCEPWVSDGSGAGTTLLQDIAAGADASSPGIFTAVGDTVFFTASETTHGNELWKMNADGGGATLVKDIRSGADDSNPENFVAFGGDLYFSTSATMAAGRELWKSDGTEAGTTLVADLNPAGDSDPEDLTVVGDKLFFLAKDPDDGSMQLWITDGSPAGTSEITHDLAGGAYGLTALDGTLYFVGADGIHGGELWVSDGTTAGTHMLVDLVAGAADGDLEALTAYNGHLYFTAWTAGHGRELWVSDGTAAGTGLFADLNPDTGSSDPDWLTVAGGKLYFTAWTPKVGYELWVTDGATTVQVRDVYPGTKSSEPADLAAIGNRVAFAASDGVNGYEPWISDGTAAGTHMLGDVDPGSKSGDPLSFVLFKRHLYFSADDGTGAELWRADINRAPVASDADITTDEETAFSGTLTATDPDGDALTFGIADAPAHGNIKITDAATGEFTYTPADGYSGKDSFRFNADDGLASSSAAVSIQVQGGAPSDDDTPPPSNGGGAGSGGSGGGGAWGLLGGLLMLGALSRKRSLKRR